MFGIGTTELIVVGFIVFLLFGNRLPQVMGSLGVGLRQFKHGLNSLEEEDGSVKERAK